MGKVYTLKKKLKQEAFQNSKRGITLLTNSYNKFSQPNHLVVKSNTQMNIHEYKQSQNCRTWLCLFLFNVFII